MDRKTGKEILYSIGHKEPKEIINYIENAISRQINREVYWEGHPIIQGHLPISYLLSFMSDKRRYAIYPRDVHIDLEFSGSLNLGDTFNHTKKDVNKAYYMRMFGHSVTRDFFNDLSTDLESKLELIRVEDKSCIYSYKVS